MSHDKAFAKTLAKTLADEITLIRAPPPHSRSLCS
jgi:hypothetical protein